MTLQEWTKQTGILPTHPTTGVGAVSVVISDCELKKELWHLSDYKVSSVSGPVVWMVPK